MSNNVMWLVNKRLARRVPIAKYYPETGWYSLTEPVNRVGFDGFVDRINDVFEENGATHHNPIGPTDWEIQYDIADNGKQIDETLRLQKPASPDKVMA